MIRIRRALAEKYMPGEEWEEDGDFVLVNVRSGRRQIPPKSSAPGTELKKLLARVGITATPNCSCSARARTMDEKGCDWCEANIDTIVGWLREEATKRKLPFVDVAARMLIRRAIANARQAAKN